MRTSPKINPHLRHLLLDGAAFVLFVLMFGKGATGIRWHEWLGIGLAVVLGVHLVWHWAWIVSVGKRLAGRLPGMQRLCAVVDVVGFFAFVTSIASGLLISRAVLPAIGLQPPGGPYWRWLHHLSSDVALFAAGVHVALHWRWIGRAVARLWRRPKTASAAEPASNECGAVELARKTKSSAVPFATALRTSLLRTATVIGAALLVTLAWWGASYTALGDPSLGASSGHGPQAAGAPCEGRGPCAGEGRRAGRGFGRGARRAGPGGEHGAAGELAKPLVVTAGALVIVMAASGVSSLASRRRRVATKIGSTAAEPS